MLSEIAVVITRAAAEAVIILIAAQSRNDDDIILPRRYSIALDRLRDPEFSGCKSVEVISKAKELVSMMELEIERSKEDDKKGRTYYSSRSERRKLRSLARKIGIKNPLIYDKDIYHSSEKKEFINKKD